MISVIIPVRDAEEKLLRTLSSLVPLAAEGLIADVVVADANSRDATLAVADAAGCAIVEDCIDRRAGIARAIAVARKQWLLTLAAGDLVGFAVATAAREHIEQAELSGTLRPAAFLALPAGMWALGRLWRSVAFDAFGGSSPHIRRVLAHRAEAPNLANANTIWSGARLGVRIDRVAETPRRR